MNVTLTGATGLIGPRLVAALLARGDGVTVLSRDPARARAALGDQVRAVRWDAQSEPAPVEALAGADGVIHLAGEPIAQRWSGGVKERIRASREVGTRQLVAGLRAASPRPSVLVSSSAIGYYGPHGDERLSEDAPPGGDFVSEVCVLWEREANGAEALAMRVVRVRTGVVLDAKGGALKTMLPFFKAGVGGPVAGGRQYLSWIAAEDLAGIYLAALDGEQWSGAVNATAPEPVTSKAFARALGRVLRRPAFLPVPGFAVHVLYGQMAQIVTTGQRVVPARAQELGFSFRHAELDGALRAAF
jgi:uncharacterized protein (TIGR01777 family)